MKTNEELRQDVMDEINWNPKLRDVSTQIGVSAHDGVITLSGLVDTYSKKLEAEKTAQRVSGVKVVACDIDIRLGTLATRTDTEIAETIKDSLRWNSAVDHDQIEVKVDNGWVYLEGKVDWNFERLSAQNSIHGLLGVRGVTNNIKIKPRPINTKDIGNKISGAFHRNATLDSSSITIEALGNKVILSGIVRSWAERKDAERIAWSAPGVTEVENKIEIDTSVYV